MGSANSAGDSASKAHETRRCDASLVMHWRGALAGKCVCVCVCVRAAHGKDWCDGPHMLVHSKLP
jgi:hypothetical protein